MNTKCFLFAGTALSAAALTTQAAVVASYAFNNATGSNQSASSYFAANVEDANVNAGNFLAGAGLQEAGAPNPVVVDTVGQMFTSATYGGLDDGTNDNMNGAVAANEYFGFTVTADTGYTLDLTSLVFDVGRGTTGAQDYAVRSDVDSFAVDIFIGNDAITGTLSEQTISLADPDYQNLESIELRIYFDDRFSNTSSGSATYIDNVVLNGTAAIPEPGSFALIAGTLALCSVMLRRRA